MAVMRSCGHAVMRSCGHAVMRWGLYAGSAEDWPGFSRAMPRSTGAWRGKSPGRRCAGWGVSSPARWSLEPGGESGAGVLVGAVGEAWDTLALADPDDLWVRAAAATVLGGVVGGCRRRGRTRRVCPGG
jgi:hypothetical protein